MFSENLCSIQRCIAKCKCMENLVNELFKNANRQKQGDNRSYYVKCLNNILKDGVIKIRLSEKGKVWTNQKFKDTNGNLRKFNVQLDAYGWTGRYYFDKYIDAECVIKAIAKFISNSEISELHIKSMNINGNEICECSKCNGKGIITAFSHICNGICFDCYGAKYVVKKYQYDI